MDARCRADAADGSQGEASGVNRLRTRLILIFLAATLAPLGVTLWITTTLLEHSLSYASTAELDQITVSLERTGRVLYQRACDDVKAAAEAGRIKPVIYKPAPHAASDWPDDVDDFLPQRRKGALRAHRRGR